MSASSLPTAPAAASTAASPLSAQATFFSRRDKMAALIAAAVTFIFYFYSISPSVTLEDSGEFLTAAHHLGVPHPPGYPTWTILAWIWKSIFPFGNIAWRLNVMSTCFSTAAVALAALLISKSGHVMTARVGFLHQAGQERLVDLIILASSVSAALMLAFSPVMWSQGVIAEVYGPNAFCLMMTLVFLYRWSFEPERRWRLYFAAFMWGLGLTSHQTQVLLVVAFPTYVWFVDKKFGRDVLLPILGVILLSSLVWPDWVEKQMESTAIPGFGLVVAVMRLVPSLCALNHGQYFSGWCGLFTAIITSIWIYKLLVEGEWLTEKLHDVLRRWGRVLGLYGAVVAGLAFYGYEPLSSATNPPMNWGYTRTTDGFIHHFTRGQYEKVHTERNPIQAWGQVSMFTGDVVSQFNIVNALLPLVALFFFLELDDRDRKWLGFLFIAFVFLSIGFLYLSNPGFEKQKAFTDRVFFLPAHCIYTLCIGYGLILALGYLLSNKVHLERFALPAVGVVLALPFWWTLGFLIPAESAKKNPKLGEIRERFLSPWAGNEQRGHDFGYRFGYLMFKPGGGYPEMERDAVLYGGTDPGRFVPTYMIFVESQVPPRAKTINPKCPESGTFDRRDVYIITQNALADTTYMNYIRDHYDYTRPDPNNLSSISKWPEWERWIYRTFNRPLGRDKAYPQEPIWIPSERDSQEAFRQYIEEVQRRPKSEGEDVSVENGKVSVQGVKGVMEINGILTKNIFDHNKAKHAFYVEESYVIPWMYPYLEPYGIIMKINSEPLRGPEQDRALWDQIIERDTKYWADLSADLLRDPAYQRDDVAQKTFSKLRSAIGGIYSYRRLNAQAEVVFKQAIELCPSSPEANFHLAQLYIEQSNFEQAAQVLERYQTTDPFNTKIRESVESVKRMRDMVNEEKHLEQQYQGDPTNITVAIPLIAAYARHGLMDKMDKVANATIVRPDLSPKDLWQIGQFYMQINRPDRYGQVLSVFIQKYPQSPTAWYELAVVHAVLEDCNKAAMSMKQALTLDTPDRKMFYQLQQDDRFGKCAQSDAAFRSLLTEIQSGTGMLPEPFKVTP